MNKASSSFFILVFATLFASLQSYAQVNRGTNVIREHVGQNVRINERLRLTDLLRLSYQEQSGVEILSLSIMTETLSQTPGRLDLSQFGRPFRTEIVKKRLHEVKFLLPPGTRAEGLELSSSSEIYLESITAEVSFSRSPIPGQRRPGPGYNQQVSPNSVLTVRVNESIRGQGRIPLKQLVKEQMGLTLDGAQIERIVVFGQPSRFGRVPTVQVELNRRLVGEIKYLSANEDRTPLQVRTFEEVQQTLAVLVNGDAEIFEVRIKVGMVRPQGPQGPQGPQAPQTVQGPVINVGQEISPRMPFELTRVVGYENRLISAITIQARSRGQLQAQLQLLGNFSESQGVLFLRPNAVRATLRLSRPMAAHELRFLASSAIFIEALQLEFVIYPRY